ncbi:MAG: gamma-glutamyltransferase, partial [Planctomycetes bacterium]|nr:gamma-glutamyltransferase [Planctomycetota bacterium]
TNYRGYDVWELPPNGQGIAALQMLNLIEPYNVQKMGRGSADWFHLFVEAKKLAFADRAVYYADPDFNKLPTSELISKEYAGRRGKLLSMEKAATSIPPGDPKLEHGDTVYLTVVDKDRNCCSFIQSNFGSFGSFVVPGDVGFVMQNRGSSFALNDKHVNRLEPHKRPFHTIIPAMVTKEGKPWFCYGVMGGDMQAQGHVQVLVNLIDFNMNVQEAGDEARVEHSGSATPLGSQGDPNGGLVSVEPSVSTSVVRELERKGHKVTTARGHRFGGYQGILLDWKNGMLHGATESRKDGCAAGY